MSWAALGLHPCIALSSARWGKAVRVLGIRGAAQKRVKLAFYALEHFAAVAQFLLRALEVRIVQHAKVGVAVFVCRFAAATVEACREFDAANLLLCRVAVIDHLAE